MIIIIIIIIIIIKIYVSEPLKACNRGRGQPHSPGWASVPLSSFFFLKFPSIFSHFFPQTLLIFSLRLTFGPPGGRVVPRKALVKSLLTTA